MVFWEVYGCIPPLKWRGLACIWPKKRRGEVVYMHFRLSKESWLTAPIFAIILYNLTSCVFFWFCYRPINFSEMWVLFFESILNSGVFNGRRRRPGFQKEKEDRTLAKNRRSEQMKTHHQNSHHQNSHHQNLFFDLPAFDSKNMYVYSIAIFFLF